MAAVDETAAFFHEAGTRPPRFPVPMAGSPAFAAYFDHTQLKLDATRAQIDELCAEAREYGFKAVCVRPPWVERCVANLKGSDVVVGCTVGFHEGTQKTAEKVSEAMAAVAAGAGELDMVMNHPAFLAGNASSAQADIEAVRRAAPAPIILKVILETSQLTVPQIAEASKLACAAGADFIKTSTGFNGRGATVEDVQVMRHVAGTSVKVKASGGVRTAADAIRVIEAGADRIGASAGVAIMKEAKGGKNDGAGGGY